MSVRWAPATKPVGLEPHEGRGFWSIIVACVVFVAQFALAYGIAMVAGAMVMAIPATVLLVVVWLLAQVLG